MPKSLERFAFSDKSGFAHRVRFPSANLADRRNVDIWCPVPLGRKSAIPLPVIYMHDGQNLFDPALSFAGVDWGMDEAIVRLTEAGVIPGAIVVGIWNSPQRKRELMPKKPFEQDLTTEVINKFVADQGGLPYSDDYLKFIVEELKPFVDENFPTSPDPAQTFVMGSSMGGLASLNAIESYPDVFGGAGCLSTHWVIGGFELVDAMGRDLPDPSNHRLYFDRGTIALDESYGPLQERMDAHLADAGYVAEANLLAQVWRGHDHSERAWRRRVDVPLRFLLGAK
ncbi:hypothetical protein LOC68_10075 [Blastopirellula sp. JC732]|uniref:Esterase n=1 Tax=Blastopirellula sediminis TaxID=2894196 RepID=A0A9X1MKX9_9BACT|nr:alpha/beta hydrolase-fold protein [Blastopirellula sediminis]MCC9608477.1 hypothetical protein [Blastopirellula sediminis]MCC9628746.1 hypothetical protein [Blastopirellula sediminis]